MLARCTCLLFGGLLLLTTVGCNASGSSSRPPSPGGRDRADTAAYVDIERLPKRDDIVRIVQFWGQDPWIYDSVGGVIGFKVPTYYVSSETEKGAFVSGRIFVWLHVVQRSRQGDLVRRTVHMWQMDQKESFLFASRKPAVGGYFYGFILTWPRSLDLSGQTLEVEFAYERGDGRLVLSAGRTFRVPLDPREAFTEPMIRPKQLGTPPADDDGFAPPRERTPLEQPVPRREPLPPPVAEPTAREAAAPTATPAGGGNRPPSRERLLEQLEKRAREIQAQQEDRRKQQDPPPGGGSDPDKPEQP